MNRPHPDKAPARPASRLLALAMLAAMPSGPAAAGPPPDGATDRPASTVVFRSGQDGYHTYRIPALAVTCRSTVLAFCEGRKLGRSDSGDIDLLLKRSTDGGRTWSAARVLWDDKDNTCGNPCVVVDRHTTTIWLLCTWNRGRDREADIINQTSTDTRRVFVMHSRDDGQTWSAPLQITAQVKDRNWTWYATGPGSGIQIRSGPHAGQLVIPCDHIQARTRQYFSHVIFSDDHGRSWQRGGSSPRPDTNECQVVELAGGRLMLNMRNYDRRRRCRQIAFSDDGGRTWKDQQFVPTLVEPICQAAIERYRWPQDNTPGLLLFSNPASTTNRHRLTVRTSADEGCTWSAGLLLHPGPAAYSDLAVLPDGSALCLYEAGTDHPYQTIRLARFVPAHPPPGRRP